MDIQHPSWPAGIAIGGVRKLNLIGGTTALLIPVVSYGVMFLMSKNSVEQASFVAIKGKVMFFVLCLIMIPLATAELATDGWIQTLMKPTTCGIAGCLFSPQVL